MLQCPPSQQAALGAVTTLPDLALRAAILHVYSVAIDKASSHSLSHVASDLDLHSVLSTAEMRQTA